jgi:uncharacterized protein (DUF2147 family)
MMKSALLALTASLALVGAASATDVVGVWRTSATGVTIEISRCGSSICGKILDGNSGPGASAFDVNNKDATLRAQPILGLVIMKGFSDGPTSWDGGTIYNPHDGGTYTATVNLASPGLLSVKACAAPMLCKTQTWTRLK